MKSKLLLFLTIIVFILSQSTSVHAEVEQPTSGFNVYISSTISSFKDYVVWYNPEWSNYFMTVAVLYGNDFQHILQTFWFEGNWVSQMEWYLHCTTPAFDGVTDPLQPQFLPPELPTDYISETSVVPYMACYKSGSLDAFVQVRSTTVKSLGPNPAEYHTYVPLNLGTDVYFGE